MIIIGPNTQVINFSFAAGGTSEGSPPPPAAVSFDVGGEGFTAQTKASAPRASSYTRRDHERLMFELEAPERARQAAAAAAEKARIAKIYQDARDRRAARIAEAEARLRAARFGNKFST